MSGFSNAILGGASKLIRAAIQSPNYVVGATGWSINKDGSSEFNDVTARGDIVVGTGGSYNPQVHIHTQAGTPNLGLIEFPTNSPNETRTARIFAGNLNPGQPSEEVQLLISGGCETGTNNERIEAVFRSNIPGGGGHATFEIDAFTDSSFSTLLSMNSAELDIYSTLTKFHGAAQFNQPITAEDPISLAPETWHPLTLMNSWANFGSLHANAAVRLLPTNDVQVAGRIKHAAISGTSQIGTMPYNTYTPAHDQDYLCAVFGNTAAPVQSPVLSVTASTGALTLFNLPTGTTSVSFNCIFSMDA